MRWPVFAALVPELVPRPQLPAALALNGITINASRIVGPLVGGLVLATAGGIWVFLLNAALSLATGAALLRWKRPAAVRLAPRERLVDAMRLGVQHVGQSPLMHTVLLRVVLYFLQAAGLTALLPLVARSLGGAGTFTMLLAGLGAGAVLAVFQLPWMRRRWAPNELVLRGTLGLAATMGVVALAPTAWIAAPAMVLAGVAWIAVLNSLSLAAQMALPNWVRARGMAIYQMALMGGNAAGAALWGQVASHVGVHAAMGAAALCGVMIAVCGRGLRLTEPAHEDIEARPRAVTCRRAHRRAGGGHRGVPRRPEAHRRFHGRHVDQPPQPAAPGCAPLETAARPVRAGPVRRKFHRPDMGRSHAPPRPPHGHRRPPSPRAPCLPHRQRAAARAALGGGPVLAGASGRRGQGRGGEPLTSPAGARFRAPRMPSGSASWPAGGRSTGCAAGTRAIR